MMKKILLGLLLAVNAHATYFGSPVVVKSGGTGQSSYTDGQLLIGNSTGNTLTKSTLTAGSGISITNGSGSITIAATGGGGSVTTVSVVSANGFAGSVANATSTPAITISTSVTGILKGNGTAISAATANTDYLPATSGSAIQKADGSGGLTAATGGTDYEVPLTISTGLTRTVNTITVNTTQNITKLSNLTSNGYVKTSGGDGTLGVQTVAIPVADGGTGQTSYTDGQLLIGNSSGNTLTKATLTAGSNITITNGNGSITIASTGGSGGDSVSKSTTITSHGFSVGDILYLNGSTWTKAIASSAAAAESIAMVTTVTDANTVTLTYSGYVSGLSGLTAGTVYFLDPSTAGTMTATEPTTAGQVSKPVGVALSSTTFRMFDSSRGALISSGGGSGTIGSWATETGFSYSAGFGTVTGNSAKCRQVGENLECELYVVTGTVAASTASFDLPTTGAFTCTIDTSALPTTTGGRRVGKYEGLFSSYTINSDAGGSQGDVFFDGSDTNTLFLAYQIQSAAYGVVNGNGIMGNSEKINLHFSVPCTQF